MPPANDLAAKAARLESRFLESFVDDLLDRYVDPRDEFEGWSPIDSASSAAWQEPYVLAYRNEADLTSLRNQGRQLVAQNEFAINAVENRISYVIGTGHSYGVAPRNGVDLPPESDLIEQVDGLLDEFCERNRWAARQQEILLRRDRDGECFLRYFVGPEGLTVRFVEPEDVRQPRGLSHGGETHFGITFKPGDLETPETYWINDAPVPAEEIQHRKANVDLADPRGVSTFYPIRKNLVRAAKILRNMSTVAEIQAAIAMVRQHTSGSQAKIQQYVTAQQDASRTDGTKTRTYKQYPPGSILDTGGATEYKFPVAGVNVERFVAGIQAELRAVASRLVMPEFMLTSDASNANYSSTMVAEGPAVKMFERMQAETIRADLEVLRRAVRVAIDQGRLPIGTLELVEITAEPPRVQSRDRLKEVQADAMLLTSKVMSRATMAARHGLDYEAERTQMESDVDRDAGYYGLPEPPGKAAEEDDEDDDPPTDENEEDDDDGND